MIAKFLKRSLRLFIALLVTGFLSDLSAQDFVLSNGTEVTMRTLTTDIHRPWEIVVLPENKILVTERDSGFVSMFDLQTGQKNIVYRFANEDRVNPIFGGTGGILGMLVHPDFSGSQPFVYLAYTSADFTQILARFRYDGSQLVEREILIETLEAPSNHGSRLTLLPDSTILMTTGSDNVPLAQDTTSLIGKILRLRLDGSAPLDNPFYNENDSADPRNYIYSLGHRNAQGITVVNDQLHPFHGNIYASEHGSRQNDEINFIEAGKNYGWPNFEGWVSQGFPENEPPMVTFDLAPTGIAWYNHPAIPEWSNKLIMGTSKGQQMVVWGLNDEGNRIANIDTTLSTSNNAVIENGEHSFTLFFNGNLTRPRCITPLADGRILLGLWSEVPGEPDRVVVLSNDVYQPSEISWSATEVQFGSVEPGQYEISVFLRNQGNSDLSIDSLSLIDETFSSLPAPIANPFSILMEVDFPAIIGAQDSLELRIVFDGVIPGSYQSRIIAYSSLETISLIISGEVTSQNNVNEIQLPEGTSLIISTITENIDRPWDIEIAPDGYLWVTERDLGQVKRINPENGGISTVLTMESGLMPPVIGSNGGLLGIAIHPEFNDNKPWVYLAHTNIQFRQVLSRFEFNGSELVNRLELLSVQDSVNNYGSRISFLPDNSLLWTTGTDGSGYAQNRSSLAGKIIRINEDGSVPQDNPFANSTNENEQYLYSLGHRNIQGLHVEESESNPQVFVSEHGEIQNDEINIIAAGGNYGWPNFEGWASQGSPENEPPMATYDLAPTGIALYNHEAIPEWQNTLLLGTNKGQRLLALRLNEDGELLDHDPNRPAFSTLRLTENNQYFFYNNGFPDRPRDIEIDELGRIYLAMFGTGGSDRILRLENQFGVNVEHTHARPYDIFLSQNYPNPFNPSTNISFELPKAGLVQLKVFNMLGQEVANLIDGRLKAGNHTVDFNASQLSSGVYVYRLISEDQSITKKMMLIK